MNLNPKPYWAVKCINIQRKDWQVKDSYWPVEITSKKSFTFFNVVRILPNNDKFCNRGKLLDYFLYQDTKSLCPLCSLTGSHPLPMHWTQSMMLSSTSVMTWWNALIKPTAQITTLSDWVFLFICLTSTPSVPKYPHLQNNVYWRMSYF